MRLAKNILRVIQQCLIGSQRVHRINDQRLDAGFSDMIVTVFQDRAQKAFCFSRARAGCHQGRDGIRPTETVVRSVLVYIRRISGMQRAKALVPVLGHTERELHRYIWFMEEVVFPLHKAANASLECRRRDRVRRVHILDQAVAKAGCEN